jgi:hypothetical protein
MFTITAITTAAEVILLIATACISYNKGKEVRQAEHERLAISEFRKWQEL